ncbi:MAG: alkaline phosphatase family protein [Anaeroplasmataceae bacterium]|nr:alkaline phosphatase family protein [Anaeroplasmataceae bacterium]
MQKTNIKENYEYWYFDQQKEYFETIDQMLNEGYQITDSIHLCVELTKENKSYLLSFISVERVDENIKDTLHSLDKEYKLVYPNYDHCILNTISSIRKQFNGKPNYALDEHMEAIFKEKRYKNVIVMLLDGMGENILENNLDPESFLRTHHLYTNTAIYPSTTAASTTATVSGLSPIRTGWLGWQNYFKEIRKNIILFNGRDYFTDEPTGFSGYKALHYEPFYADLKVNGSIHNPNFKKHKKNFKKVLKNSLKAIKKKKQNAQYVYFTDPDGLMHEFGTFDEKVIAKLKEMDKDLAWYANKLPKDTLLVISADHGHTNIKNIEFYNCTPLLKMLNRRPSNDSRCITFSVKEEYRTIFPKLFQDLFGYAYDIMPSSEAMHQEFFGKRSEVPHTRVYDFLADYVAVAKKEFCFNYKGEENFEFKSHHAGITADEMLVPVIVFRK